MSAVASATRTVVIAGARPNVTAAEAFGEVPAGDEALLLLLGLDPSPGQRRLTDDAIALAEERMFLLTAELVPAPSWLREHLREGDAVRVIAGRRERRRWRLETEPASDLPA